MNAAAQHKVSPNVIASYMPVIRMGDNVWGFSERQRPRHEPQAKLSNQIKQMP